jgi:hypothetical protein
MTQHDKVTTARSSGEMFVISGRVATLYVTEGTVNLLQGMQGKMAATGMGAVIQGMSGTVANAAMISMYEGERVQHFGCYIGEQLVIGTFENIGFMEGEDVKVVASRLDERAVFAHAVVRPKDGWLWMPLSISKGRRKIAKWIATLMVGIGIAGMLFFCVLQLFISAFKSHTELMLQMTPVMLGLGAVIGGGAYWSSLGDARYAESIFKVLGFKNPKIVNISPFSEARLRKGASYMVYDLRAALRAYDSLSKAKQS